VPRRLVVEEARGMNGKARPAKGTAGLWRLALVLAALSGCAGSSNAPARQTTHEVKGKFLLANGKPLNGGDVYFVPLDGAVTSEGKIAADGTFSLSTAGSGAGVPAGQYKVRVEPTDKSLLAFKRAATPGKRLPFPFKYLDEDSSRLQVTIRAGSNTLPPFHLD
jgi:hypothetical protein